MFHVFEAATGDLAWQQIAEAFRRGDFRSDQASRNGSTSEILHAALTISNPRQRWVVSRRPVLNIAFALAEVIWIVRGRNDSAFLNYFNRDLPKFAGAGSTYHGAYGYRLRTMFGFDQLARVYLTLKHNPESRQAALQIWNPSSDVPDINGQPVDRDVPCNMTSLLKIRDGRLEWLQLLRSNDVFRGLPYNLIQFTTLQEVMAGWLGVDVGEYHQISDSLHVYDDTAEFIMDSSPVASESNNDNLAVSKTTSDSVFEALEHLVDDLIAEARPIDDIATSLNAFGMPLGYSNMARVLCAEAARRRGSCSFIEPLMAECTNPVFTQLYSAWLMRVSSRHIAVART